MNMEVVAMWTFEVGCCGPHVLIPTGHVIQVFLEAGPFSDVTNIIFGVCVTVMRRRMRPLAVVVPLFLFAVATSMHFSAWLAFVRTRLPNASAFTGDKCALIPNDRHRRGGGPLEFHFQIQLLFCTPVNL
jgi:hypothetical protein